MSFLFGGDTPKVSFNPIGASGGGLNTNFDGGGYKTSPDATRLGMVGNVAGSYSDLADKTAGLGATVAPGYNDLLNTQLSDLNDQAHKAIGDLRTNLQSRRVLGSSFGNDTLTRANAEIAKTRSDVISRNFLQSLDARNKLLQQEYQARTAAATTGLNELNLEAGVASGLIGSTNKILSDNAQFDAKMEAASQAGAGKFLGTVIGGGIGAFAGGPAGAMAGAKIGGSLGGGDPMSGA